MNPGQTDVEPQRVRAPVVKVRDVAYLRSGRAELARAEAYYTDFGLVVAARTDRAVYLRGVLGVHHCWILEEGPRFEPRAIGFHAARREDLDRLAALPGASPVEPTGEPGGGERVRLTDPAGLQVEVIFGMARLDELPHRTATEPNLPTRKVRVNRARPEVSGPSEVFRLGHVVLTRQEYRKNSRWYCETLGLIPSDILLGPGGEAMLAFLRCDRGAEPADHHTVVIGLAPENAVDHCAFEVLDDEAVAAGGEWLQRKGHSRVWGVGRHTLSSAVFDYVRDPDGLKVEHFADVDVFDAEQPTGTHPLDKAGMYTWGPLLPRGFIDESIGPRKLLAILHGLRRSDEFTLGRLLSLKKALAAPPRPWS